VARASRPWVCRKHGRDARATPNHRSKRAGSRLAQSGRGHSCPRYSFRGRNAGRGHGGQECPRSGSDQRRTHGRTPVPHLRLRRRSTPVAAVYDRRPSVHWPQSSAVIDRRYRTSQHLHHYGTACTHRARSAGGARCPQRAKSVLGSSRST